MSVVDVDRGGAQDGPSLAVPHAHEGQVVGHGGGPDGGATAGTAPSDADHLHAVKLLFTADAGRKERKKNKLKIGYSHLSTCLT